MHSAAQATLAAFLAELRAPKIQAAQARAAAKAKEKVEREQRRAEAKARAEAQRERRAAEASAKLAERRAAEASAKLAERDRRKTEREAERQQQKAEREAAKLAKRQQQKAQREAAKLAERERRKAERQQQKAEREAAALAEESHAPRSFQKAPEWHVHIAHLESVAAKLPPLPSLPPGTRSTRTMLSDLHRFDAWWRSIYSTPLQSKREQRDEWHAAYVAWAESWVHRKDRPALAFTWDAFDEDESKDEAAALDECAGLAFA